MILLDTCTFLWLVADQERLSNKAHQKIAKYTGNIYLSAISAFEIAIKVEKEKLKLPLPTQDWFSLALKLHGIKELAITSDILISAAQLPQHHFDPADRIIIATAERHNLDLITPDAHIKKYINIEVLW